MDNKGPLEIELLERARSFDHQALATIYDLYSPGLYRYAMRLLGDQHLAEDCVSETFSRFLQALQKKKGPRNYLQAYLYRVAHNIIVDLYRRQPPPEDDLRQEITSTEPSPEEHTVHRLRQTRLRYAMQKLTPDQQKVITLKYLEGWDTAEIAQMLGKPVGAVKALQHRAIASLQRILQLDETKNA